MTEARKNSELTSKKPSVGGSTSVPAKKAASGKIRESSPASHFEFERRYVALGRTLICGVDEAGRGPLAGPVSVAACIMPLDNPIEGVDDSKKLTPKKRDQLFDLICERAIAWHVSLIDREVIDEINIYQATKRGMRESVLALSPKPDVVLIDAVKLELPMPTESIIHGDALSYSIACASILAKVTRDRLMEELDKLYPEYGFAQHKGYATRKHIEALQKYGKCPIHRESFMSHFFPQSEAAAAEAPEERD